MSNSKLEAALEYAGLGWYIFPCHSVKEGKCSCGDESCKKSGKHPRTKNGFKDATIDESVIREWWTKWPDANISCATGTISGIVVLDIDAKHGRSSKEFQISPTVCARSGGGGEHFVFKHPGGHIKSTNGQLFGVGVDIKGDNGYVILAPSQHESGNQYEWIVGPDETELTEIPAWLLAKIKEDDTNKTDWRVLLTQDALEGMRNGIAATIVGGLLRTTNQSQWERIAWPRLQKWNRKHCKPPLHEKEIQAVYESIVNAEQKRRDSLPEEEEKQAQKMELMKLVTSNPNTELFRDNYGDGHARVVVDDHKEIMVCSGTRFNQWLNHSYMEQYGNIADPAALKTAIHAIESIAIFKGKEYKLHNRVAKVGDTVWFDLADERNRAVKITPTGWGIVDEPPILFRRHIHQKEQVEPQRGGDIKKLFDFINVTDPAQQLLLLVYLVACFIPDFPHVLLYIHGEQGSSKSTVFKILQKLVDPTRTEAVHMPKDERELKLQLSRHHLISYDNVERISDAISAVLCIGVTGGSSSERLYFTNGEDFIFDFQLNIGLNGINISAIKPDLLERSLLFGPLKHVEESERRDEAEIKEGFEPVQPKILGAILDVVAKALAIRPSVKLAIKPRMADFSLWGVAITEALGHTREQFLDAYNAKINEQSEEALAGSNEAAVLIAFMLDKTMWKGTAQELLNELSFVGAEVGGDSQHQRVSLYQLPNQPQVLMRRLNTLKPNLLKIGIKIISGDRKDGIRIITIIKIGTNTAQTVNTDLGTIAESESEDDKDDPDDNTKSL